MGWRLVMARPALRDLERIDRIDTTFREHILGVIESLVRDPSSVSLAKLGGTKDRWRVRAASWRILLQMDNRTGMITVLRVLDRKDAYK